MKDLIERLERATGPDRELDARIWSAVNGQPLYEYNTPEYGHLQAFIGGWRDDRGRTIASPAYTASLDAALTLVPAGLDWFVKHYASAGGKFGAVVTSPEIAARSWGDYSHDNSPTPALALCIAALKAREAAK